MTQPVQSWEQGTTPVRVHPSGVELEFTCAMADAEADGLEFPDVPR